MSWHSTTRRRPPRKWCWRKISRASGCAEEPGPETFGRLAQREAELLGVVAIARSQAFSRPEPPIDTSMHLYPIDGAVHLEPEPADGTVYR